MKKLFFIVAISFIVVNLQAQITVSSTNNVGIGTTTPIGKLQVAGGTLRSDLGSGVSGTSLVLTGEHANLIVTHDGSTTLGFLNSAGGGFNFYTGASTNSTLWLNLSSKYVGINNASPSCALDVTGVIKMNGSAVTSDERLKEDIKDMTGALASLSNLRGVTYKLKHQGLVSDNSTLNTAVIAKADTSKNQASAQVMENAFYSRDHKGFLAQDVMKVYPELVYADKDGMLSVDYVSLIPVLVESIKEQQAVINDLKATVEKLKKKANIN